ncbi:MAG: hypothetical protein K0R77_768 [Chryseobacterium sp.]|jgi:hypothetical protein|uniref:hypothetical protein n=1 Tax=Chryseobacterium sp. TaxID=1871047 RepID=UPI00261C2774|nr:hypothetical protein [Chryseobacterium sp.]MDF2551493.1 hypothetical protein [Chryseobacterium sp.]
MDAKLEIISFNLNPYKKNEGNSTFSDIFNKKIQSSQIAAIYQKLVNILDNPSDSSYHRVGKKAFTLIGDKSGYNSTDNLIYGLLKGGDLGNGKTKGKLIDKNEEENLDGNVINDKYFFIIYFPLNDKKGYVLFQSYKDEGIRKVFIDTIMKQLFSLDEEYKKPTTESFYPAIIKEEFKQNALVKEIKFTDRQLSSRLSDEQSFQSIANEFKIEVKITPIGGGVATRLYRRFIESLGLQKIGDNNLQNFDRTSIVVQNEITKKVTHFELGNDFEDIKPRIYLKDRVDFDNNELPEYNSLKEYCLQLLSEIKNEDNNLRNIRRNDS